MKQKNLQTTLFLLAALTVAGCSNENDPISNPDPNDRVELGITAGVALTKSVITGGTDNVANGTDADLLKSLRVYANGTGSSYGSGNNVAGYTINSSSAWVNDDTNNKIYLTNEVATIYAYHPLFTPGAEGVMATTGADTLDFSGTGTSAVIPITLFPGSDSKDDNNTIPDADNSATNGKILSAPGEVDYMWADQTSPVQANNGKGTDIKTASVTLSMKHALSMVSFRIYNDGTYKNNGLLTKIKLGGIDGVSSGATMNITSGVLSENYKNSTTTLSRFIGGSGVTIGTNQDNAHKYSMLVLPDASSVSKSGVKVTFTIDGADYPVDMTGSTQWKAGENNLYTATLKGTGLVISSVKVAPWGSGNGGSLDVH